MNDFSTYSWKDKKEEVTIPIKDSKEVAEFLGIMVGDGGIDNRYLGRYEASVCCNLEEDYEYVLNYVIPLIFKLFNKSPSIKQKIKDNAIYTRIYSKAIVLYLMKKGLPKGKKVEAIIDINSLVSKEYVNHFLRGLADTDFCLRFKRKKNKGNQFHFYPCIVASFGSADLVSKLSIILTDLGFYNYVKIDRRSNNDIDSSIEIQGEKNLEKWMNLIGFSNSKHLTKYQVWKKFGFCPPRTTLAQRKEMLIGNLDPYSLYKK